MSRSQKVIDYNRRYKRLARIARRENWSRKRWLVALSLMAVGAGQEKRDK